MEKKRGGKAERAWKDRRVERGEGKGCVSRRDFPASEVHKSYRLLLCKDP